MFERSISIRLNVRRLFSPLFNISFFFFKARQFFEGALHAPTSTVVDMFALNLGSSLVVLFAPTDVVESIYTSDLNNCFAEKRDEAQRYLFKQRHFFGDRS